MIYPVGGGGVVNGLDARLLLERLGQASMMPPSLPSSSTGTAGSTLRESPSWAALLAATAAEDAAAEEAELSMDADTPARTAGPLRGPSAHRSQLSNPDSKTVTSGAHVDHHPKSKAVRWATSASNANGRAK